MNLHVVVAGWLLGPHSGANRRLLALLSELGDLLADDERVTVLHRPSFAPPPLPHIAWRAVDIPPGPTLRRARAERRRLPVLLRQLAADVYDHGFLPAPAVDVPTCLLVHDVRAADTRSRWPRVFARHVLRRSCRRAAAVVTPSAFTAARIAAHCPGAHATVVPNAVATPATSGARLPRPAPANGYLLHVGHVEPRKNLGVVATAVARLPARERPELWLAGRDAGALRHLRKHTFVRALGVVDDDTLDTLYRRARAVVLPSSYEGFGLPVLEALARGRPVYAADTSALPEVLGDAGVLLPPHDPRAWAAALRRGQPDDEPDRRDRRAFAAARTWRDGAADLLALWRRLATASQ